MSSSEIEEAASLRAALRLFLRRSEEITRQHGLPPRHYELLLAIKASEREQSTVSDLVEFLQLTQSSVTELVQRLEAAGLVERKPSSLDGRVFDLRLTSVGRERLCAAVAALGRERKRLLSLIQPPHSTA